MNVKMLEHEIGQVDERSDILDGLSQDQKQLSPKYFYDETGSRLFDQICDLPEYYLTRTELGIMREHVEAMTGLMGPRASIIELGSGSSLKTRILLDHVEEPAAYVPVDISRDHLLKTAGCLADDYPEIEILPVCADFTQSFELPEPAVEPDRHVVYFPGSTIGNFSRDDAIDLLKQVRQVVNGNGALLIGVDLIKPRKVVEAAYNDTAGVTAKFNKNILARINRDHAGAFDPSRFEHDAVYDEEHHRIEMRLISCEEQDIPIAGQSIHFEKGEYIVTEHSHKYSIDEFGSIGEEAEFSLKDIWTDPDQLFSVQFLEAI
ncbi:MAG: L-histidine N(alpha)-methyltransferase [Gammaproteobacteria bacterium]|nr:L-histidine N(alpha)-methyltransferase [Gammaproteobacteria bacterium]